MTQAAPRDGGTQKCVIPAVEDKDIRGDSHILLGHPNDSIQIEADLPGRAKMIDNERA
jgi:hypothetical protein